VLVLACTVLGCGVALVLLARFGGDGYSSQINGLSRWSGLPYAAVNWLIGFALVLIAWSRGVRPGPGTITHPIVVGLVVDAMLHLPGPSSGTGRGALLVAGIGLMSVGVAGYLDVGLGSGPFEAATFALRPIPFRLAYTMLQAAAAVGGWLLGSSIGAGTILVVFGVGPLVGRLREDALPRLRRARRGT
jgi:uncharacterized membrane protein YczE